MGRPKKQMPNRADGLYEIKITLGKTINGKLIRKSFYSHISKEDAKKNADQYLINLKIEEITGEKVLDKDTLFEDWAVKWLNTYIKGTVKDNTYHLKYYSTVENHLIPYFKKTKINAIKQIDVQNFVNLKGKEKSLETLKVIYNCLNRMFDAALDNGLIVKNPCKNVKLTSKIKPQEKGIYTANEVSLILDYAKTHNFGLEIIFLIRLGLRRGELLGIKWDDIDFKKKTLHIQRAVADVVSSDSKKMSVVVDDTKTIYSNRVIPIPEDILTLLEEKPRQIVLHKNSKKYKEQTKDLTFVFSNSQGNVCSPRTWSRRHYDVFMNDMINYYKSKTPPINIDKRTPHELRHTLATLLVNSDKNLFAIASVLGWGDLKMLRQRYAHFDVESTRVALNL